MGQASLYLIYLNRSRGTVLFTTRGTRLTVPPGILSPGDSYSLSIVAVYDGAGCAGNGDARLCEMSLEQGGAQLFSGILEVPLRDGAPRPTRRRWRTQTSAIRRQYRLAVAPASRTAGTDLDSFLRARSGPGLKKVGHRPPPNDRRPGNHFTAEVAENAERAQIVAFCAYHIRRLFLALLRALCVLSGRYSTSCK